MDKATLAGGCFWCLDGVYQQVSGVQSVVSGYIGGHVPQPNYRAVCNGITGHAEAVEILFDPQQIGYGDLLDIFFAIHDPTTPNRQGYDVGTQYRSAIFYHDDNQQQQATTLIDTLNASGLFPSPIVTEVTLSRNLLPGGELSPVLLPATPAGTLLPSSDSAQAA
ncbi:peptide-methionine (S)-S-oxide reductase MsrA [Paludibacterium denitrificans]|uniref:peptide-methionine (S)-S-oxide reductase MsrA n=1 Tax=Paludibacterium denitrificans TaxID=2675226 RepID=UPI0024780B80|nr:peptide-methionine (S)-S-oxide reductase MsrA [Paludibacterium denitrificans]